MKIHTKINSLFTGSFLLSISILLYGISNASTASRGYPWLGELVKGDAVITTTSFVFDNYRSNGLRIPNANKGYYYFRSADVKDTDNHAILSTLQKIEAVGSQWEKLYPDLAPLNVNVFPEDGGMSGLDPGGSGGIRFGVGDLSRVGGREFPPHSTHQNGLDVDVRYMRRVENHNNHFHIRFPLTNPPVGDTSLSASSNTIPANGVATTDISSDVIKDSKGWLLLNGTLLTVTATDSNGKAIGFLPPDENFFLRGKQISVNSEGKLNFTYKAGITPGAAKIQVWVGYGKADIEGLLGQIEITLSSTE